MQEFQQALMEIQNCDILSNRTMLLSTSRCRAVLDTPVCVMQMQPLTKADAQSLLVSLCPACSSLALQLAEQCGNIPLALEVVAKTVQQELATAEVFCFDIHIQPFICELDFCFCVCHDAVHPNSKCDSTETVKSLYADWYLIVFMAQSGMTHSTYM